jgi:multicomponent Na+:H+ antiporter subunit F
MDDFFRATGIVLLFLMVPVFYRMISGPTAIDRIVATNIIGTKTAVLLVVIGTLFGDVAMFVDFALAYALLNFIGSLAAARYFSKTVPSGGGLDPVESGEPHTAAQTAGGA